MKIKIYSIQTGISLRLLLSLVGMVSFSPLFAQHYNAGAGSGTGAAGGYETVFVGPFAGASNTTGNRNTFLGSDAGYQNTTGYHNSFLGSKAGYANTTGFSNSFVGSYAGRLNTTGYYNSFLGNYAGYANTTGYYNSFLGTYAGYANTTGAYNSFLGTLAGYYNTTGSYNSFLGTNAGRSNTTGNQNSFLGNEAGFWNTTGSYNTLVGTSAGYFNTGSNNSFLGRRAGFNNTTGAGNCFLGSDAGYSNTTGSNNSFIGTEAGYLTTGGGNSFMGYQAGYATTTGYNNSFLGYQAGLSNTMGISNLFLGAYANASAGNLSNAGAIGVRAYVSASNSLVLGSINGVNGATASTNVGIGTNAPTYLLHVNGDAAKPGGGSWTVASDRRLKKNVSAFTQGLEVLTKVKPVWFQYNGEAGMPTGKTYVGVIAQEMQQIAPYMVGSFAYQDTTGKQLQYLDYDANALSYILVNAVKEQQKQLEEKDARIESLEARINRLEQLLSSQLPAATAVESDAAARLWQNEPNPTDGSTLIRFRIPRQARQVQISLYSVKGEQLKTFPITQRGEGQLSLDTTTLPEGIYLYRLLIDGKQIDAKKLLLNR